MRRSIVTDEEECTPRDERFYTPRAQAASARSWSSSYGTPRGDNENSARSFFGSSSSASESEYVTPSVIVGPDSYYADDGMVNYGRNGVATIDHHRSARPYTAQSSVSSNSRRREKSTLKSRCHRMANQDNSLHPSVPRYPGRNYDADQFQSRRGGGQRVTYYDHSDTVNERQVRLVSYASVHSGDGININCDNHRTHSFPATDEIFSLARHSHFVEIEKMFQQGLSPDIRDDNGNTLLAIGCQNGNKRIVKMALRYGADIDACNFRGNSPLHFCFK